MPIDRLKRRFLSPPIIEGLVLLAVAPWLLFPSQFPLLTLAALIVLALIWLWPWLSRKNPLPFTPFNGSILLFEIAILIGIIVTADPNATLSKATGIILGLTAWRFIVLMVRDKSTLSAATGLFLLIGLGFIVFGILGANWMLKAPFLKPIVNLIPSRIIAPPEAPSVGVHANQLAGVLLFYFPVILSLAIGWRSERRRKTTLIFLFIRYGDRVLADINPVSSRLDWWSVRTCHCTPSVVPVDPTFWETQSHRIQSCGIGPHLCDWPSCNWTR